MNDSDTRLTPFEHDVLRKLLEGDHSVLAALRAQLPKCAVIERESTGCGFLTTLEPSRTLAPAVTGDQQIRITHVAGDIPGLARGAEFVLFVANGYLDQLEGFALEEEWPGTPSQYTLFFEGPRASDPTAIGLPGK